MERTGGVRVAEILKITNGKLLSGDASRDIDLARISTDSRTIKKGDFFLPLKGENFDGEKFVSEAFKKGAMGSFVVRCSSFVARKIIIQVKDTTKALQQIAHAHRMMFDIPVIGITGSNGKTTAKDMIYEALSPRFSVLKNEGTKNNHLGVPQTLLKLSRKHKICVLEMGMNHKGEIRLLAGIARPNIAVITNVGPSHLKFLKDLKGVFESKKEITEFLGKGSLLIVNGDDKYLSGLKSRRFKIERFGIDGKNDLRASLVTADFGRIEFLLDDKDLFRLNILGTHNVYNALAAIAVARQFRLSVASIRKNLAGYRPGYMRLNIKNMAGITVIDDSYNSNPLSMRCALQTMREVPAVAKWVVSADMLELGDRENDFHKAIGEMVAKSGFQGLLTFGKLSRYTHKRAIECGMPREFMWHCSTRDEVADILRKVAKKGDAVLVKGSRAMKMEEVVDKLSSKS